MLDELCNSGVASCSGELIQVRLVHGDGVLALRLTVGLHGVVRLWHSEHSDGDIENISGMIQLL